MLSTIAAVSFFALGAFAKNNNDNKSTSLSIFLPGYPTSCAFDGSVSAVGASDTTFVLMATSGDATACQTSTSITVTVGPATFSAASSTSTHNTVIPATVTCSLSGSSSAVCASTYSTGGSSSSTVQTLTGTQLPYFNVQITAGAQSISKESTTTKGNAAPTAAIQQLAYVVPVAMVAGALL